MFIIAKRNIILPSEDGSHSLRVQKEFMGNVPDWAAETAYFKELVADGKIIVSQSARDRDIQKNAAQAAKAEQAAKKRAAKAAEE